MSGVSGARLKPRNCGVCGRLYYPASGSQKYCAICGPIVNRFRRHSADPVYEAKKERYAKERAGDFTIAAGCKGCKYWRNIADTTYACHYLLDEYVRRPCPPGEGCTVRVESVRHRVRTKSCNPRYAAFVMRKIR